MACVGFQFTWLQTSCSLWSTIPQVAMPIKWTCWALSFNWAPRDMTVWPRTASPTWRMTPVFVPPVMIQAPVVWAACGNKAKELKLCATLSNRMLQFPLFRTFARQRSFLYTAVKIWNDLDVNVKQAPSLCTFKKTLKDDMIEASLSITSWT